MIQTEIQTLSSYRIYRLDFLHQGFEQKSNLVEA